MPEARIDTPTDNLFDAWISELETEQAQRPPESATGYKGWFTPIPETWLPEWVKFGYNNSIDGLAKHIISGKPAYQLSENYTPDAWGDIGATIISFLQPTDIATLVLGGGVGGMAFKQSAKEATKLMIKAGIKKEVAEAAAMKGAQQFAKKVAFDKKALLKYQVTKQAGSLGFYSGIQNAEIQKLTGGDIDFMETLEATAKGAALGAVSAGVGTAISTAAIPAAMKFPARYAAEVGTFGTVAPMLEGKMPSATDYIHAAGVIGGLSAVGFVTKPMINKPWNSVKKSIWGDIKKRQLSTKELQDIAEAKAQAEIGRDIWSDGERDVIITKDWTNSNKLHTLDLKDVKTGETFPLGKTDFFIGARNEAGNRISKPFQRLSIAGEPLKYKEGINPSHVIQKRTFGLKDKLNVPHEEFKNMVDEVLGRTQKTRLDKNGRVKSGWDKLDTQQQHMLLQKMAAKKSMRKMAKQMAKLGENEVYYQEYPLEKTYPKVHKTLQKIAAIGKAYKTAGGWLARHPVGQSSAKMMINAQSRSGALTGEYFTMLEGVEIGKTKLGKKRKFFNMTREESEALARDLERSPENWQLPYTKKVKKLFDMMYAEAERTGMPIKEKIENYFPHLIKEDVLNVLQKDVDRLIHESPHEVLGQDNIGGVEGVEAMVLSMMKSGKIDPKTVKALEHMKNKPEYGSYSSAFESIRNGVSSEKYTLNKHLEKGRKFDLPDEFLQRDARVVVPEYIQRWSKRVSYVENFGVKGEKMFGNINALQSTGFHNEANVLRDTFDSFTNLAESNPARNYKRSTKNFWNAMVNFGIATKIGGGFATLPNLSQPLISSMLKAGIPWRGMFRYTHDPAYRKFIKESGAMNTSLSVHQLISGYNPTKGTKAGRIAEWTTKYVGLTVPYFSFKGLTLNEISTSPWKTIKQRVKGLPLITFQTVNRNNQILSAIAGYEGMMKWQKWANGKGVGGKSINNRLRSIENLNQMGLIENYDKHSEQLKTGKITRNEFFEKVNKELNSELKSERKQREATYRFAIDSQLQRNILREPVYFNDPRFRPFILFKRFGYRQFEYILKNSWNEFKHGNALYFLRLAAGGMVAGPLLNSAKRMLRDALAGEDVYDDKYSVTEEVEDYDNIKAEMEKNGYSIDSFFDAAKKTVSVGDILESFAAIGAYGFVGDVAQAMYEGEQRLISAGEFLLKPAVLQDMMVGIDTATRFLVDKHEYGWANAIKRMPKSMAPAFGTIVRETTKRVWTEGQWENYQKYRKGRVRGQVLDAFLDGDDRMAQRYIDAWNRANPDNQFDYNDISWSEMFKRAERKAKKRLNP